MSDINKASMDTGRTPGKLVIPSVFGKKAEVEPVKKKQPIQKVNVNPFGKKDDKPSPFGGPKIDADKKGPNPFARKPTIINKDQDKSKFLSSNAT